MPIPRGFAPLLGENPLQDRYPDFTSLVTVPPPATSKKRFSNHCGVQFRRSALAPPDRGGYPLRIMKSALALMGFARLLGGCAPTQDDRPKTKSTVHLERPNGNLADYWIVDSIGKPEHDGKYLFNPWFGISASGIDGRLRV